MSELEANIQANLQAKLEAGASKNELLASIGTEDLSAPASISNADMIATSSANV